MPVRRRSIRRPPHHTNTCSGAAHTRSLTPRRPPRARPRSCRSAPRADARGRPRARRRARVPPASHAVLRARRARAAWRSGAGTSAALHHTAGPVGALQPRARRTPLTLGGRPADHAPPPGLCRPGSPGEWGAVQRNHHRPRPAANSSEPRRGRGSRSSKPAATYSPGPLRAKYHRR